MTHEEHDLVMDQNWVTYTVRYVTEFKKRRLTNVTASFDAGVTSTGALRLPCAYNSKGDGYYGFPLQPVTSDHLTPWPSPLRRPAILMSGDSLTTTTVQQPAQSFG